MIKSVKSFNYLGLIIDSKIRWDEHIDHVIKRISPYIFILKRLRRFFNRNQLCILYIHILSHIVYLNPTWNRAPQNVFSKFDIAHKKSIV